MDRVLRNYAHTAWTPADPLAGLDPVQRRAILMMPSTFRERWKVAPWTSRAQRRQALIEILAERRLLYDLTYQEVSKREPAPTQPPPPEPAEGAVTSPYYRYRLGLHTPVLATVAEARAAQEQHDRATNPEAAADHSQREQRRLALRDIQFERAKLDLKELRVLSDPVPESPGIVPPQAPSQKKIRRRDRGR